MEKKNKVDDGDASKRGPRSTLQVLTHFVRSGLFAAIAIAVLATGCDYDTPTTGLVIEVDMSHDGGCDCNCLFDTQGGESEFEWIDCPCSTGPGDRVSFTFSRVRDAKGERSEVPAEGGTEPREQPGPSATREAPNNP